MNGKSWPKDIRLKFKTEALRLRKLGHSFAEINKELGISNAFQLVYEDKEFSKRTVAQVCSMRERAYSFQEIADKMGIGTTTVRAIWYRAEDDRQKAIIRKISQKTGKRAADARWGKGEDVKRENVLKMRATQQKTMAKRRAVIKPEEEEKEKAPLRAVAYLRVSTEEQARKGISLDFQEALIKNWAAAKELELVKIIQDPGSSGKNLRRPGLEELMKMCREDGVDQVIIYKLDRLSRRIKDMVDLVELFEKQKVDLSSVTESLDTSTAMGRMFFWLMTVIGALERERIGERVSDARSYRDERGFWTGRMTHGYGKAYDKNGNRVKGKLSIIKNRMSMYRKAKELWESGIGVRSVAKKLKVNPGLADRLINTDVKELRKKMKKYVYVSPEEE